MPNDRQTISMRELARLCGCSRTTVETALCTSGRQPWGTDSSGRSVVIIPRAEALAIVRAYLADPPPIGRPYGSRSTSYRTEFTRAQRARGRGQR